MKRSNVRWIEHRWPLIEKRMRRGDCLEWLKRHGYPEPAKSACTFCPYHSNEQWRALDAEDFADAVKLDTIIRHQRDRAHHQKKVELFLHRSAVPLDQVDLSTPEERGQLNLFLNECEGMCGV
jgi:hypothetical protein